MIELASDNFHWTNIDWLIAQVTTTAILTVKFSTSEWKLESDEAEADVAFRHGAIIFRARNFHRSYFFKRGDKSSRPLNFGCRRISIAMLQHRKSINR